MRIFNTSPAAGLLALGTLLGSLAFAAPAKAARYIDVTVINRSTGERLTPYRHAGKLYVAGSPGDRYGIELASKDGQRLMTVISVDGVNVLSGETAAPLQSGYVLDAGQRYAINGWRKNMDEVAQFLFTALPDSYAARTGRPDNVGVIGVAVFRERVTPPPVRVAPEARYERERDSAGPAPAAPAALGRSAPTAQAESNVASKAAESAERSALADNASDRSSRHDAAEMQQRKRLGTGHGEREHAPTRSTEFVRASDRPDEIVTIYYDSRPNLIARGIIRAPRLAEPRPFPGGFVPDPRG